MPDALLTADEAAAIALEKYGPGWICQDGGDPKRIDHGTLLPWSWWWCRVEPHGAAIITWMKLGGSHYIGSGRPNPEWRSSKMRIDHPPKGTT